MQQETTGATVSRLAVLTVLTTMPRDPFEPNWLSADERKAAQKEIRTILSGKRGKKIAARSLERCAIGGAALMFNGVPVGGRN